MTDAEFVYSFLDNFAKNVSLNDLKKARVGKKYGGYLWHLFSNNLITCYEGNAARKIYDKVDKTNAIEIQYDNGVLGDKFTNPLEEEYESSKGLDSSGLFEFYVIGQNFEWCYVVTHEFDLCGPYFCFKPNSEF